MLYPSIKITFPDTVALTVLNMAVRKVVVMKGKKKDWLKNGRVRPAQKQQR
jgi:hypothetical protein